jgi:hypothetical protein
MSPAAPSDVTVVPARLCLDVFSKKKEIAAAAEFALIGKERVGNQLNANSVLLHA